MPQLSSECKFTKVKDHSAAATSAVNSDSVDMSGWDGVVFLTSFGTAATDNTANGATSSDDSTFNDLLDTETGATASDEDIWLDIYKPLERYLRLEVVRGTSTTLESIWAIQYRGRKMPVDNTTTGTIIGEAHVSPAEGTA